MPKVEFPKIKGVLIHHGTVRNGPVILAHPTITYKPAPWMCTRCKKIHTMKTFHIDVNNEGDAIVSVGVYERLREIPDSGFEFRNPVKNPPPQRIQVASPLVFPRVA